MSTLYKFAVIYLWILFILHFQILVISSQFKELSLQEDSTRECIFNCSSEKMKLFCGTDDKTYNSRCEILKASCEGHSVQIKHRGKCKEKTACQIERANAQKTARKPTLGVFIPECNEDGSFRSVQCHSSTGYCWCATEYGKPIPGTSIRYKSPNCPVEGSTRRRTSRGRKESKGCAQMDRAVFNDNLIKIFKSEYARLPDSIMATESDSFFNTLERKVIDWKFSELDKNNDQNLNKKELRSLKRNVKKIVKPRPCAKTFVRYCDLDQDKKITRNEWSLCLGVSINSEQTDASDKEESKPPREDLNGASLWDRQISNTRLKEKPSESSEDQADCYTDRQTALDDDNQDPDRAVFIPECSHEGKFRKAQCHKSTGYCWCVNEDTGKPIPGTSTQYTQPDCDGTLEKSTKVKKLTKRIDVGSNEKETANAIPGCPNKEKQSFLEELVLSFKKEMEASGSNSSSESLSEDQLEDTAIRWKFDKLDFNSNSVLHRKEWKVLKKELKKIVKKNFKKCSRNFVKYCDENNDKKITLDEWKYCMTNVKDSDKVYPPINIKRRGPNPFSKYLKSD